ncbi:MAG TPA: sigma-70 family RNA polymerase sigma factor [Chloroflexota bacterium]|nr:sigma-70 family RNA polymerase sigma factor [Chloroflexota bacterium]
MTNSGIEPTDYPEEPTDESLLRRLAGGDSGALGALYDRFGRLAYALAYRMLADQTAAEDVVQEAFVSVWRNAPAFNPERGSVRAWLLTAVRNRCIDTLRGPRLASKHEAPVDLALEAEARDDVLESVLRNLQAQDIQRALDGLPEEQRTTVNLAFFGGLTHTQIAAQTRVPLGTVKGRMRLALDKLRELLTTGGLKPASEGP